MPRFPHRRRVGDVQAALQRSSPATARRRDMRHERMFRPITGCRSSRCRTIPLTPQWLEGSSSSGSVYRDHSSLALARIGMSSSRTGFHGLPPPVAVTRSRNLRSFTLSTLTRKYAKSPGSIVSRRSARSAVTSAWLLTCDPGAVNDLKDEVIQSTSTQSEFQPPHRASSRAVQTWRLPRWREFLVPSLGIDVRHL